ncbi:MAG TPA: glycosyltransferase family 39 protein, partial [Patescibacteria group bacterium]
MQRLQVVLDKAFREYGAALGIFILSRVLIFITFYAVISYGVGKPSWTSWDAGHYLDIAVQGYTYGGANAKGNLIAFFPLYPLLIKGTSYLLSVPSLVAALLNSFIFGLISTVLLYRYVADWKNKSVGLMAVFLFAFYPMTVFVSAPYTESLFFALTMGVFLLLRRNQLFWASILIGLTSVTRMTGVLLVPLFLYVAFRNRVGWLKFLGYSFLMAYPFLLFLFYQYVAFGTPLAFSLAQHIGWGKTIAGPWVGVITLLNNMPQHIMWQVDVLILAIMCATLILSWRKVDRLLWFFGLEVILLTVSSNWILGTGRYMMLMLPFYVYWAEFLQKRETLRQLVIAVCASWAMFNAAL